MLKFFLLLILGSTVLTSCLHNKENDLGYDIRISYYYIDDEKEVSYFIGYNPSPRPEGNDGVFGTSDDDKILFYMIRGMSQSNSGLIMDFADPGPDQLWFTSDDVVRSWRNCVHEGTLYGEGQITWVCYDRPNSDIWPTGDEAINSYSVFIELDNSTRNLHYNSAGSDTEWFTEDDELSGYNIIYYDDQGDLIKKIEYIDTGEDRKWLTDDDLIRRSYYTVFDNITFDDGSTSKRWSGWDIGEDQLALTQDDYLFTSREKIWPKNRIKTELGENYKEFIYVDSGNDTVWFSSDDNKFMLEKKTVEQLSESEIISTTIAYADIRSEPLIPPTDGDVFKYTKTSLNLLDNNESLKKSVTYNSSGQDGIWLNSDDEVFEVFQVHKYDNTNSDKVSDNIEYKNAGKDGIWLTSDDEILWIDRSITGYCPACSK